MKRLVPTLEEIRATLLSARDTPDYNMGSPRALDHLLLHVVMLIDAIQADRPAREQGGER